MKPGQNTNTIHMNGHPSLQEGNNAASQTRSRGKQPVMVPVAGTSIDYQAYLMHVKEKYDINDYLTGCLYPDASNCAQYAKHVLRRSFPRTCLWNGYLPRCGSLHDLA